MKILYCLLLSLLTCVAYSQNVAIVKGKIHFDDGDGAGRVTVQLKDTDKITMSNDNGYFELKEIPMGEQEIVFTSVEIQTKTVKVHIDKSVHHLPIKVTKAQHDLHEVHVRHKTEKRAIETQGFAVSVIETKEMATRNMQTNEILDRSAGIRVRQNGGLGSQVNYNLNGMSGESVRVFIDGIPMSSYGSSFSLNSIPAANIERIEVYKGVIPAHLADDALGGAINVILKKGMSNNLTASVSYGSFNTLQANASGMFRDSKSGFTTKLSAFHNYSDNDYEVWGKFVRNILPNGRYDYVRARRFNDAYRSTGGQVQIGFTDVKWADQFFIGFNGSSDYNEIQHGTYMSIPYKGRFSESTSNVFSLNYRKKDFLTKGLEFTFNGTASKRNEVVVDTVKWNYNWYGEISYGLNGEPILRPGGAQQAAPTENHITRNVQSMRGGFNYDLNEHHRLVVSHIFNNIDRKEQDFQKPVVEREFLGTRNLTKNITSFAYEVKAIDNRLRTNLFAKLYSQDIQKMDPKLVTENGETVRRDVYESSTKKSKGYGLAASYAIVRNWYVLASAEKAVRLPSESEVFGNPGENIIENFGIRPEVSNNVNIGFKVGPLKKGPHRYGFGATGFIRDTRDKIQRRVSTRLNDAVQTDPFENLGKIKAKGFEAEGSYSYKGNLNVGFNFSRFNSVYNVQFDPNGREYDYYNKQLPNEPYFTTNLFGQYRFKDIFAKGSYLSINYGIRFVERFYTTWLDIEDFRTPRQYIQDLGASYTFPNKKFIVSADLKNMFDQQSYDNFAVQKPGRAFYIKLNYSINNF